MTWWNQLGLQLRIMAYVTAGLLVLFGTLGYFATRAVDDSRDDAFRERIALANSLAQDVQQDFEMAASDVRMGAESIDTPNLDLNLAAQDLSNLLKLHTSSQFFHVSFVSIMNEQGQLLAITPATGTVPSRPNTEDVQIAIAQNRPVVLRSQRARGETAPFASLVVPVSAPWTRGQTIAIVADTVGVSGIPPAVPGGGTGYSMEIVGSDDGTVLSTSLPEEMGARSHHYVAMQKYVASRSGGIETMVEAEGHARAVTQVVAITPLPSGPFYLILEQPANLALTTAQRRQNEMLALGAFGVPLALAAAWYTTRRVVRPVEQLRSAAQAIAQGNLDVPVHVPAQDELHKLAEDIETMRQQLKKSRDSIEKTNLELEQKVVERTQKLQETLGKVITAQEEERRRLALELHDEQAQALGALTVSIDRIGHLLGSATSEVRGEIERARDTAQSLLQETRRLIYDLRPSVLDDMGLEAAIRWCADNHLKRHGVEVTIRSALGKTRLPGPMEVALFRVAQEAIVNVERHSGARHAGIALEQQDSAIHMQVWDDGKGFVPGNSQNGRQISGVGLEGMQERVRLVGGKMEIDSDPGKGTTIRVEIPLDAGGQT